MAPGSAAQPTLDNTTVPRLPTRRCRDCKRELTDPVSRLRQLGPECDPDRRNGYARHEVEQEPLPGT
jgi:hypothetical protein